MKSKRKMLAALMSAMMCMSAMSFVGCAGKGLQHVDAVEATCTTDGHTEYYTGGGKYYSDASGKNEITYESTVIPASGHTAKTGWSTSDAQHWHDCSVCGKPADDKQNHVLGEWVYDVPPTATTPGEGHKECSVCEFKTVKETVPPTGGAEDSLTHVPALSATCERQGNIEYWTDGEKCYSDRDGKNEISRESTVLERAPHTPETEWNSDDPTGHWHDCSVCGKPADAKQPHSLGEWVYDKQPSATETGLRHKECACGYATEPETVPTLGTVTHHTAAASTCTVHGNIEYWEKNGNTYSDAACTQAISSASTELPLDPDNHVSTAVWDSDGTQHWHKCPDCAAVIGEKTAHDAYGSWTDNGTTCKRVCDCGHEDTKAHSFGSWAEDATDADKHVRECGDCGKTERETHSFGAWADSSTDPAKEERSCSVCGKTESRDKEITVTVTHHDAVAPTCTADGTIEYWEKGGKYYSDAACTNEITDISGAPALGHDYSISVFVPDANAANGGRFFKQCSHDASHKEDLVENAYYDRHVKIGETVFTAYDCYTTNKDKGVTYDVIKEAFVIDPSMFASGIAYSGNDSNNKIIIKTDADTAVASISIMGGYGHCAAEFVGNGKLTVNGSFTSEATLTVASDIEINGNYSHTANGLTVVDGTMTINGSMSVNSLTVGDASGTGSPVLNVKSTNNGISGSSVRLLSGTVNVQHDGDSQASAIDLGSKSNTFTVGENARLKVKGYTNGFYNTALDISGTVYIVDCTNACNSVNVDVKAGQFIVSASLTNGFVNGLCGDTALNITGGTVSISAYKALNNVTTVVDGGRLDVVSPEWIIEGGSVTLTSGHATIMRSSNDTNYAAFNRVSSLTVAEGFDLGIKNLAQLVYDMNDSTITVSATVTTENVTNVSQGAPSGAVINGSDGTVTPATVVIPDIPDLE